MTGLGCAVFVSVPVWTGTGADYVFGTGCTASETGPHVKGI